MVHQESVLYQAHTALSFVAYTICLCVLYLIQGVTVIVARKVKEGKIKQFEEWMNAYSTKPGRLKVRSDSQGLRFIKALLLSKLRGTETWSGTMSQLPSIFRKHVVDRSQKSVLFPFFNVPLIRLRL